MSRLFEALSKATDAGELDSLLEGQAEGASPELPPPEITVSAPEVEVTAAAAVSDRFEGALAAVRVVRLQVRPASPVLPFDGSHWRAGEQYRMLRTKINQHPKMPRVLVVTSAGPNDGKTVTAINLAGALALKSDARVLLVDGDFRRSTIATQLGLEQSRGIAEVLTGECALHEVMVQAEQISSLFVVPAGQSSANPAELLDSATWHAFLEFARTEFKYIVIDSPPLGALADYDLIQAIADAAILVVRPDQTDRQLCLKALNTISKDKMLGVVLNCFRPWLFDKQANYEGYLNYYRTAAKQT